MGIGFCSGNRIQGRIHETLLGGVILSRGEGVISDIKKRFFSISIVDNYKYGFIIIIYML